MTTPTTELALPEAHQVKQDQWGSDFTDRFWSKVDKSGDCWEWQASRFDTGYGCIWVDGRAQKAHRIAWTLTNGPIAPSVRILHRCDNRPCCRPDHLFAGSMADNTADMVRKGRHNRHGRTILTPEQVRSIRTRYAAGGATLKDLGAEHKVSWVAIWKVIHRKTWADVA